MRPVCFHDCAGWLHEAPAPALGRAAVIAGPHGFEDLCARRTLRMLADRLAQAGVTTLRFDWSGAGDSLGDARDPDRLSRWREDLAEAIALTREATGADEIAVIGLRFGALLAAELGTLGRPVARVALLAPPPSGRGYARELKALSRVMPDAGAEPGFEGLSVAGLRTSAETLEAMRGWCFSAQTAPPACDVLIVAPDGALGARVAAQRMEALGARVETSGFPGYDKMMCDPTASEAALDLLDPLVEWARRDAPSAVGAASDWPFAPALAGDGFFDEPVRFGPDGCYGGVICRPRGAARGAPLVFLNAGGTHHGGWARVTVEHARALAAHGVASLRIDLPGVGDSRGFEERARPAYYAETQVDAALTALDFLEARGFAQARVMGACSGAHHAFHAARLDPRVVGAMMVNLQLFAWTQRSALAFGAWMSSRAFDVDMRKRVEDAETATLSRLQARLAAGAVQLAKSSARTALRALRGAAPPRAEDGEEGTTRFARGALETMSARGVDVAFVFGESDSGWAEFERHFGPRGEWGLSLHGVSLDVIADTDHPLTPPAARARLFEAMQAWLTRGEAPRAAKRA